MNQPKFSVIIPTLNEEHFLPQLLTSLAAQSFRDFEVIVVDGKSKDKTIEKAQSFAATVPNLQIIVSKKASLPAQRNLGAATANGQWLVFVDADSVFFPYAVERMAAYVKKGASEFFSSWFAPDSDTNNDALIALVGNLLVEGSLVVHRPFAPGPLTVVSRRIFDTVHGYNEHLTFNEDYDFSQRVVDAGEPLTFLRETLYEFSQRRIRNEGKLKIIQTYLRASLLVLLTKRSFRHMPGYIMGGHLYTKKKKPIQRSVIRQYEQRLRKLMTEFFES